jgi:hypothetical protein
MMTMMNKGVTLRDLKVKKEAFNSLVPHPLIYTRNTFEGVPDHERLWNMVIS